MRNARARPQQRWKSCANGSNTVAPRFGDHGTTNLDRTSIDEHPIHKLASPVNHLWQMASFLFKATI